MIGSFELASAPRVIFGPGKVELLCNAIRSHGRTALLVTGKSSFVYSHYWDKLLLRLQENRIQWYQIVVDREPTPALIDAATERFRTENIEVVAAIGGGSTLDAGKAISAMLKHEGSVLEYLEGVGTKNPKGKKVPFIAVPTTAGTGSEATKNAVISEVGRNGFKRSLRHDRFVPDLAIIDPELSLSCPKQITARSGMDAFSQLLESYLSTRANDHTDLLALRALRLVAENLPRAVEDGGNDLQARTAMAYAAFISGITLANAGLGLVHGFASSVGGYFDIPHGLICGTLMGPANRIALGKLLEGEGSNIALVKYGRVGHLFTGKEGKSDRYQAEFLVDTIQHWTERFGLERLSAFGMRSKDVAEIAQITDNKYNPVLLNAEEMGRVLAERL